MKLVRRFIRTLFGLLLAVTLVVVAYLDVIGFPDFLKEFVCNQIARTGIAARFDLIRIDLVRGVLASGAVLADAKTPDKPLMQIDEVQLELNWRWLMNQRSAVKAIRIANAVVSVPTPADEIGPEKFTARDAYATLRFAEDGTIEVDRLSGVYCGIGLYVTGKIKPRAASTATPPAPLPGGQETKSMFRFVTKIVRELNGIKVATAPQLDVDFNVDLANPLAAAVKVRLRGDNLQCRGLNVDLADVNVEMANGAIELHKFLAKLYGGELSVSGSYDIAHGKFDLRLNSTTDPTALSVLLPPTVVKVVQEVHLGKNPVISARYHLSPATGSLPELQATIETGAVEFRGVKVKSIKCALDEQGPLIKITDALIVTSEGQLTGHGQIHIESSDFSYELDSTIDPTKLLPVMTPVMKQIFGPAVFETPPHVVASVTGDFVDPDNFAYDAVTSTDRCSYRGVSLKAASATLKLRHSKLDVRDLVLEREEGTVHGHLFAEFDEQRETFEIESTANPTALAPLLGEKAGDFMKPYQCGQHTTGKASGVVYFREPQRTEWTAQVTTEQGSYRGVPVPRVSLALHLRQNQLEVHDLVLATDSGETRGQLLSDFNEMRINFDLESTANPWELAPFIGDRAVEIVQTYRFGLCTQAKASGTIDLFDASQSVWTAHIMNEEFGCWKFDTDCAIGDLVFSNNTVSVDMQAEGLSWWKLKADRAKLKLLYADNVLAVDDFDADFYDGKLRGQARLSLNGDLKYYLSTDTQNCDVNRLMNALRGEGRLVTGKMKAHTELTGQGADLDTMQGNGSIEITDAVLLEFPLFGIFSRIINDVAKGAGTTKITRAKATYAIVNSTAHTEDLEMAAGSFFTVNSRGKVRFDGGLDFRVQAVFLKGLPPPISVLPWLLTKVLEYKVGGTIASPSYRPIHVPKELLPHDDSRPHAAEPPAPAPAP